MSVRIIIEADPRGGKTTLARELANRLRLFGIRVDIYDNDINEPNDQPYPEIESVEHIQKMFGIAQASENTPVEIVTRYRLREVEQLHVFNQPMDDYLDDYLIRAS